MLRLSVAVISARLLEGKVLLESSVRIQGINRGKVNSTQGNAVHFLGCGEGNR